MLRNVRRLIISIPVLILGFIFVNNHVNAQNMIVSGASVAEVNGVYSVAGTSGPNNFNYYQKGSLYLYNVSIYWTIGTVLGDGTLNFTYYYKNFHPSFFPDGPPSTPAGYNLLHDGNLGSGNNPDVTSALPVELTSFTVNVSNNISHLSWKTATEVNNYGFNVERKFQGGSWQTIIFIEGHGNSNSPKNYSFSDKGTSQSGTYLYRLKQIDIDGTFEYSDEVEAIIGVPTNFELSQNYPNPFNPTTSISYSIPNDGHVLLNIYDILGKEVGVLVNGFRQSGSYTHSFDASKLTGGYYFYTIRSGNFVETKKMLLLK